MKKFNPKRKKGPEAKIQESIIRLLEKRSWFVKVTHGGMYQAGFPDLFATHRDYGSRWIEVKNPKSYKFTVAQLRDFPQFCSNGSGVWILVSASIDEYMKLFKPSNWHQFLDIWK